MSVKIVFKEENEKLFWQYWQTLVIKRQASYRYLRTYLEQNILVSKDRNLFCRDKSFIYIVDNEPIAGVFLPIEKIKKYFIASIGGSYIIAPLLIDKRIEKKIFSIIDEIAVAEKVGKIMFLTDPLDSSLSYNYFQKYCYLDTSILEYIIDLGVSDDLLAACRKGHRCDIKKISKDKNFSVFSIDKNNPSYKIHEEYRKLHHKCAGRVTRSKETFDLQFEELKEGKATLFGLKYKEKNVAYSYFGYNGSKAIYASGADDPAYDKFPLYHILLFSAMQYLKGLGIRYIDTDRPSSPSTQVDYYPDSKQLNIALFKRGFGGNFSNCFRGIKYFSKDLLAF